MPRRDLTRSPPAGGSGEHQLEGGGRHGLEREVEDVAVGAVALAGPSEGGLHGHADGATGGDAAKQDAGSVGPLGSAGEEPVEAQLGDGLELAFDD